MNLLHNHSHPTNYLQQLNIPSDEQTMHHLSVLIEYHLLCQKKLLNFLMQSGAQKDLDPIQEKGNMGKHRCLARIHNGNQCSRKCTNDLVDFCGSHIHSLPYGRIDHERENIGQLIEKKSRGRKSKSKSVIELEQIDLKEYIKTELILIDGNEFLIDENNVLFENNNVNTIIGIKLNENEYQWL